VPEPSAFQFEIAIEKLMGNKSTGTDQTPVEIIKVANRTIHFEIHKLINSIWSEEELPVEWKVSITVPIYKKGDKKKKTVVIIAEYHFCQVYTKFHETSYCQRKLLGIINGDFDVTGQLLLYTLHSSNASEKIAIQ